MAKELTDKQQIILDFLRETVLDSGVPPTVREVAERFEMTVKGAYDHIKAIERKGHIRCGQNKSRAIELIAGRDEPVRAARVPLLGRIAAGAPVLATEDHDEYAEFPAEAVRGGTFFALRVKGDSMTGAGILEGDVALIRQQSHAEADTIVAALIDGEATLKTLKKVKGRPVLMPENPSYSPIVPDEFSILGILSAIYREY